MKKIACIIIILFAIRWSILTPNSKLDEIKYTYQNQELNYYNKDIALSNLKHSPPKQLVNNLPVANESTGNNTNLGLAVHDKDKIYYSDEVALWVMNKDGSQVTKIVDDNVTNIQIQDDMIYYIKQETSEIYKIQKDGTKKKKISNDKVYSINLYKNKIYFMDRYNKLYITSMSLDGKNKKVIKEVVANDMMVYDDYIYYVTRDGNLGKVKIDGSNSRLLETDVMQFDVSKSGIYYIYDPRKIERPKGLYRIDFQGNNKIKLIDDTPYNFNASGNLIYFNHPLTYTLYSMKMDGTEKTQLTGNNSSDINLAGDYIFYRNLEDNKKIYRIDKNGLNRISLQGTTKVTNSIDLTKEVNELYNKEIAPKLERAYNDGIDIISRIIKPGMTDYEKAKAIHDYIVINTVYDEKVAEDFLLGNNTDSNAFTAYGVIVHRKGVCQGYAEAAQILFAIAGIPSKLVIGNVKDAQGIDIPHMWNIVWIDKKPYMVDVTWDDPVGARNILIHEYFLVDDETMKQTHSWLYDEYPPCTSTWDMYR